MLLASHAAGGSVPPMLALAECLVARGHDVTWLGQPSIGARAAAAGCRFSPFEDVPDYAARVPLEEQLEIAMAMVAGREIGDTAHVECGGNMACYVPSLDTIRLPAFGRFERPTDFYSTSAHEHVHWTGHASRLGRDLSGRFGDRADGAEELVAELGAAFWCGQFRLEQATRTDHAAYLGDHLE